MAEGRRQNREALVSSSAIRHLPSAIYNPAVSVIGIDLGARRIGIAVSDSGVVATPHSVLRNEGDVLAKLEHLGRELDAETFVVGIPKHARANEQKFHDFADALRQKTCKQVVLWDETLSTVEAMERLRDAGRNRREAQKDVDMHAAAVILQSYLDRRSESTTAGRPS
jgi:putative Holliday junction resolvase